MHSAIIIPLAQWQGPSSKRTGNIYSSIGIGTLIPVTIEFESLRAAIHSLYVGVLFRIAYNNLHKISE